MDPHEGERVVKDPAPSPSRAPAGGSFNFEDIQNSVIAAGENAQVHVTRALSKADEARKQEDFEREKLARGVARLEQTHAQPAVFGEDMRRRPFKYLLPFDFADKIRFFGRSEIVEDLFNRVACSDSSCRLAILHGDSGMGKTSLLNAGLVPALLYHNHFPLLVHLRTGDVVSQIKAALIPDLHLTRFFQDASLADFLHNVQAVLENRTIFVMLDRFERFLMNPAVAQDAFPEALARCLFDASLDVHWLLSLRSGWMGHLRALEESIPGAYQENQLALPPFTAEQAYTVFSKSAALADVELEPALVEVIVRDLGPRALLPAQIQIVGQALIQGRSARPLHLSLADLQETGSTAAILEDHLDRALSKLSPDRQTPVWQILSGLAAGEEAERSAADLHDTLEVYGVQAAQVDELLQFLTDNGLVQRAGDLYRLSGKLLPPVREWESRRSINQEAQAEFNRQLQRIRNSSLRGVGGGFLGFALAFLITNWPQIDDPGVLLFFAVMEGIGGVLAGGLPVFMDDIARASYRGSRGRLRVWTAMAAGAAGFGLAMLYHEMLESALGASLLPILLAGLQGAVWGAAAGLGLAFVRSGTGPKPRKILAAGLASGLALLLGELFAQAYRAPSYQGPLALHLALVALAGVLMPVIVIAAANWGDPPA